MRLSVYIFAWDIVWRGSKAVAAELAESGICECHVALVYHAVSALCPDAFSGAVFTRHEGRFFFQPSATTEFGAVKPVIDELAITESELEEWVSVFSDHGIVLVPWITPTHDVSRAPAELRQTSVLGDSLNHSLCPSNAGTEVYVSAIARDLDARQLFPMIEIEHVGFGTFDHWRYAHHPKAGSPQLHEECTELLSLCFCSACKAAAKLANLDTSELVSELSSILLSALAEGGPPEVTCIQHDKIKAYRAIGRQSVHEYIEKLRSAITVPLSLSALFPMAISGFDARQCVGKGDQLVLLAYGLTADDIRNKLNILATQNFDTSAIRVVVELGGRNDHATLAEALASQGVRELCFYNYGLNSHSARREWARCLRAADIVKVK